MSFIFPYVVSILLLILTSVFRSVLWLVFSFQIFFIFRISVCVFFKNSLFLLIMFIFLFLFLNTWSIFAILMALIILMCHFVFCCYLLIFSLRVVTYPCLCSFLGIFVWCWMLRVLYYVLVLSLYFKLAWRVVVLGCD